MDSVLKRSEIVGRTRVQGGMKTMSKRLTSSFAALAFALISHSSPARSEQEFTDLVAKVMPSVVNIAIEAKGQRVKLEPSAGDLEYATYVVEYVGAGSIVDPSGLIITNRHVVKDAYEIDVTLSDGATYKGELLGAGSGTDLAILKIDVGRPLPAMSRPCLRRLSRH
jgi:serine protease Do